MAASPVKMRKEQRFQADRGAGVREAWTHDENKMEVPLLPFWDPIALEVCVTSLYNWDLWALGRHNPDTEEAVPEDLLGFQSWESLLQFGLHPHSCGKLQERSRASHLQDDSCHPQETQSKKDP